MEVVDPGHFYFLSTLDPDSIPSDVELRFVKREGEGYPGNVGHHSGTTTQEVLRALIDRTKYVDAQIPHHANTMVLHNLREALFWLESRAAGRHGRVFNVDLVGIEDLPTCPKCGHIGCPGHE